MSKQVTRREFLNLVGAAGGTAAALKAGSALGLLPNTAHAATVNLSSAISSNRKVAILGAGLSGLTVAYELSKVGYDCTILEASHRSGGRIFTVRHGDLIDEIGNRQYCEWDDEPHMYFNAGAARIPSTHKNILGYCKELGVELEVFINENKTSWLQDDAMLGGKPIRNIDYTTNTRGFLAELLAKSFSAVEMDQPFSDSEAEVLLGMIRSFGDLSEDDLYKGSFRAGYASGGFLNHGVQKDMIAFRDLLKTRMGRQMLSANEGDTGPVLLQASGGMDKIIQGFTNHVGDRIKYHAMVSSVQVKESGVDISYDQDGTRHLLQVDYCFNSIPSHLMTGIENNFSSGYVKAMKYIRRGNAYKAAFQAKERFWEKEDIYGGISWMNNETGQIWYPSHGIHKAKGIILGCYTYGGGDYLTSLTHKERVETHLADGEKIHANYRNLVEKPITVAWHRMNHMLGCAARWNRTRGGWSHEEEAMYHELQAPVNGRHYMIGDQITMHSAWQESAVLSAQWALADMEQRVSAQTA
ncbi:MAG: twin-arginine translocation pathway signal protein [SAR86 cluster bacterium]|uniref:Twin-arginine translocation pathway signal protein n=1 Tax=SAR86 cluster bacterium TaxID=2030880 RepID=A0A2A5AEX3_9GAMM|nr:MAG: twin-arginine translocation pathway signal protein [SAR86 cluster bacterium]